MKKLRDIFGIIMALFIAVVCVGAIAVTLVNCLAEFSLAAIVCFFIAAIFFGMILRGSIFAIRDCIRKNIYDSKERKYWK